MINTEKITFKNSNGDKLVGILSDPGSDHLVYISHGYVAHKNRSSYVEIERIINSVGLASFRYDFWGMGESEGNVDDFTLTESIDDLNSAFQLLRGRYPHYSLLGKSFGGTTSALFESKNRSAKFCIFLAAPFDFKKHLEISEKYDLVAIIKNGFWERINHEGLTYKVKKELYEDVKQYSGFDYLTNIKCPCLIVYGDKDDEVGRFQAMDAMHNLGNCRLEIIKGMGHRIRFDEFPEVEKILKEFINENK